MNGSLLKFTLVLNSVFLFWELIVFELLLGMHETFFCSRSALLVKIVPLRDALQLLMLFVETLTYLEPKLFLLIVLYSDTS
jgi:hypothetical protein